MIYKILNKYFGWDYIQWRNSCGQGIARIHKSADGKVFYWRYKNIKVADIVKQDNNLIWLTCEQHKYFS